MWMGYKMFAGTAFFFGRKEHRPTLDTGKHIYYNIHLVLCLNVKKCVRVCTRTIR